jgi:hypothetical protein
MNGDHVNSEKATAELLKEWKQEEEIWELGTKKLGQKSPLELVLYLASWNLYKVELVGGIAAWKALSAQEQAEHDMKLMDCILKDIGQAKFDTLPKADQDKISKFIWAGCCMHKDQNSFKGGNDEMMAEWKKMGPGVDPPVLLANKANTQILRQVLEPSGKSYDKLTNAEQAAFNNSTAGGVKTTAITGAVFKKTLKLDRVTYTAMNSGTSPTQATLDLVATVLGQQS